MPKSPTLRLSLLALLIAGASQANAYELYADDDSHLNATFEAVGGFMHSEESYDQGPREEGSSSWRDGYAKYGLSFDQGLGSAGTVYGAVNMLTSGTWGDGDAAGYTTGDERTSKFEDVYLGWRSGNLFPALGENGVDISAGRQNIVVGTGFLIAGDAMNLGKGFDDWGVKLNRGGSYYVGARKAFDETLVLRLGGADGWRGDLMHLESDNPGQTYSELNVATLEHISEAGTVGLTYIGTEDQDTYYATTGQTDDRDGMHTYSLRGQSSLGVENLSVSGEYVKQDKPHYEDENAWYLEAGWTFADLPWSPTLSYRYSRYSEAYDPLFTGFSLGYGTWVQGEVAGNFAGPFNVNTATQQLALKFTPTETLSAGIMYFDFDTLDNSATSYLTRDSSGKELDLYAQWMINDHLMFIPVVGLYEPNKSSAEGGVQLGNSDRNLFTAMQFATFF